MPIPREPVLPEWCDDQPELVCGLGWQLAVTGIFQNCADSKNEHGAANTFSTKKAKTRATKDRPKRPQRGKKTDDDTTRATFYDKEEDHGDDDGTTVDAARGEEQTVSQRYSATCSL